MNGHWQTGDRALCIKTGPWRGPVGLIPPSNAPTSGQMYMVECVMPQGPDLGLGLLGVANWWDSVEFRCVVPASERAARAIEQKQPLSA